MLGPTRRSLREIVIHALKNGAQLHFYSATKTYSRLSVTNEEVRIRQLVSSAL